MKDFFDRQDEARRSTVRLVALYALAVVGLVAALYVAVVLFAGGAAWWEPGLLLAVAGGTALVVGGGSAFKLAQLRGGGSVVAEQLGG
ncbi:MAG: peptidase M48, partial [Bacteroidetes bacterium QS_8_68_28]